MYPKKFASSFFGDPAVLYQALLMRIQGEFHGCVKNFHRKFFTQKGAFAKQFIAVKNLLGREGRAVERLATYGLGFALSIRTLGQSKLLI